MACNAWTVNCVVLGILCLVAGCSSGIVEPELGQVKGKVTLDGQPGADLLVTFEPQSKGTSKKELQVGGSSIATTDSSGNYVLLYKGATKGAVVGMHTVRITSASGGGPAGGANAVKPVNIPENYNTASNITKDVKKGDNTFDLELTTK